MSKKLKAAESRIRELLGDSIKNHRQESEFLDWVADEVGKRDATIEGLREEIKGYREWQHKQEHLRSVIQEQRDTLKSQLAAMQGWALEHLVDAETIPGYSPTYTCAGCEDRDRAIGGLMADKDWVYCERSMLMSALSKLFPSHLMKHPDSDGEWEDDWRWIVCINFPAGQATWHIHNNDLNLFNHIKQVDNNWDGHTTEEKYNRIEALSACAGCEELTAENNKLGTYLNNVRVDYSEKCTELASSRMVADDLKSQLAEVEEAVTKADRERFMIRIEGPNDKAISLHRENFDAIYDILSKRKAGA